MKSRIKVTYTRSGIGTSLRHQRTLRALGLRKLGQSAVHADGPSLRGMLRLVAHLVSIEEVVAASVNPEAMRSATPIPAAEQLAGGPSGAPQRKRTPSPAKPAGSAPAQEGAVPASTRQPEVKPARTRKRTTAPAEGSPAPKPAVKRKKKAEES